MLWAELPIPAGVDVERGQKRARAWSSGNNGHEKEGGGLPYPTTVEDTSWVESHVTVTNLGRPIFFRCDRCPIIY